jgi:PST family polysaccharide transporter
MTSGRASSALVWSFTNTLSAKLGTLAIGIVLARILGPEEFGTYAVAFIALLAVLAFNELGVSLAIVRWPENPQAIAPTVNTISLLSSGLITIVLVAVAPVFTSAMGDPDATNLVRLLALCVLINGVVASPAALLQRYFRQDRRMVADQVNVWLGAGVSLALALMGMGALSLAVGRLAGALISGILLLKFSPLPYRVALDPTYVRPLLGFGLPLAAASVLVFAVGFVDQITVGHVLGSTALGFYVLAYNLSSWPVQMLSQPLRHVAPALFAQLQHEPAAMQAAFYQVLRPLAAVALPGCLVIAASAEQIIGFVYGDQWLPAATALQWLALLAAFRILFELFYDYLVVLGHSRPLLVIQSVWLAVLTPALALGVRQDGVRGAGIALVAVAALVVLPLYGIQLHRVGLSVGRVGRSLVLPVTASGLVTIAVFGLAAAELGDLAMLAVCAVLSLLAAATLLFWCRGDVHAWRGVTAVERRV